MKVGSADIAAAVSAAQTTVPLQYFLGTAEHESTFETSLSTYEPNNGTYSNGIYQINAEEAQSVGFDPADVYDLGKATIIMARLAEHRAAVIRQTVGLAADGSQDIPDLWAFVAVAHNRGTGSVTSWLATPNPLDWPTYVAQYANDDRCVRNGVPGLGMCSYGSAVIPTTLDAVLNVFPEIAGAVGISTPLLVGILAVLAAGGAYAWWRFR